MRPYSNLENTDEELNAKEAINVDFILQNQCGEAREGRGAREVGLAYACEQVQGPGREHAQSAQQKINTTTPKKTCTRGGRKYQARARVVKRTRQKK